MLRSWFSATATEGGEGCETEDRRTSGCGDGEGEAGAERDVVEFSAGEQTGVVAINHEEGVCAAMDKVHLSVGGVVVDVVGVVDACVTDQSRHSCSGVDGEHEASFSGHEEVAGDGVEAQTGEVEASGCRPELSDGGGLSGDGINGDEFVGLSGAGYAADDRVDGGGRGICRDVDEVFVRLDAGEFRAVGGAERDEGVVAHREDIGGVEAGREVVPVHIRLEGAEQGIAAVDTDLCVVQTLCTSVSEREEVARADTSDCWS